eukprot:gene6129-8448_t
MDIDNDTNKKVDHAPSSAPSNLFVNTDKFWSKTLTYSRSTFGSIERSNFINQIKDDRYKINKIIPQWKGFDDNGMTHGRLNVTGLLGKLAAPPVGEYNPSDNLRSKIESPPKYSISVKFKDNYEEVLLEKQEMINRINQIPKPMKKSPVKNHSNKPQQKKNTKKKGYEPEISLDDLRKALLPGPGSYSVDYNVSSTCKNIPIAVIVPKERAVNPRKVLDFESLEIIKDRHKHFNGGDYNIQNDPRKVSRACSIGELRPLSNRREQLEVGPGYYKFDNSFPFVGPSKLSSTARLKPKRIDNNAFTATNNVMKQTHFFRRKDTLLKPI